MSDEIINADEAQNSENAASTPEKPAESTSAEPVVEETAKPAAEEAAKPAEEPAAEEAVKPAAAQPARTTSDRPAQSRPGDRRQGRPERSEHGGGHQRSPRFRKKVCRFCHDKDFVIDYKKPETLERFITDRGKILPRRVTGTCARHQRALAREIKRARILALIPFVEK